MATVSSSDDQLIAFLSCNLNECLSTWMQSNYAVLLTNYKAMHAAYTAMKLKCESMQRQRRNDEDKVARIREAIASTNTEYKRQIFDCKLFIQSQATHFARFKQSTLRELKALRKKETSQEKTRDGSDTMNTQQTDARDTELQVLRHKVNQLQSEIESSNQQWKESVNASNVQRESDKQKLHGLQESRQMVETSTKQYALERKCTANQQSLQHLKYDGIQNESKQLQQKYAQNVKLVDSFLYEISTQCQTFVRRYASGEHSLVPHTLHQRGSEDGHGARFVDMEAKLTNAFANMKQCLNEIAVVITTKENNHLNIEKLMNSLQLNDG